MRKAQLLLVALLCVPACKGQAAPGFPTEEAYLVSEVARTVGRWTSRPAPPVVVHEPGPSGAANYSVTLGGSTTRVALGESVWEPSAYLPLIQPSPARSGAVCDSRAWTSELLTPTPAKLLETDKVLSERLRAAPDDPCLHERAALVVGVFAAREYPGMYYDLRASLSRMVGHLALAHAYGSPSDSPTGRLAETLLLTLSWRQADVPARIAQLRRDDPGPVGTQWAHVLSLLSLQDFREVEAIENPSRLEQLAGGLAIAMKANAKRLLTFIERYGDKSSDWARIAYSRYSSVETCNAFDEAGLESVLAETELVLGESRDSGAFLDLLNEEGEGEQPAVIGRASWAAFEQRSLMTVLRARHDCYKLRYGLPEQAAAIRKEIEADYSRLRLAPFLLNQIAADQAASDRAVATAVAMVKARPDVVTWSNWSYIPWDKKMGPRPAALPEEAAWFDPRLPRGTAFDYNRRYYSIHVHAPGPAFLDQAHAQVQHALATRLWLAGRFGTRVSAAQYREHYGPIAAFDRDALIDIARAAEGKDPIEERLAYERLCTLLPEDCDQLAESLRRAGNEERAAKVYEQWAADGEAVTVSNRIDWAVEYFRTHGQKARAERLAVQAASTGSGAGLATHGKFLERIGRTEAAYDRFVRISERYDNPVELLAFIGRHPDVPRYQNAKQDLAAATFPNGLRRVTLADLASERASGAEVTTRPAEEEFAGLEVGDVIGATDGIRVTTLKEFRVARSLSDAKEATILVWRQGKWVEVRLPRAALSTAWYRN